MVLARLIYYLLTRLKLADIRATRPDNYHDTSMRFLHKVCTHVLVLRFDFHRDWLYYETRQHVAPISKLGELVMRAL